MHPEWHKRAVVAVLAAACAVGRFQGETVDEHKLRATMLLQVMRFVEWPVRAESESFRVCVLGGHQFAKALRAVSRDETIEGRLVLVTDSERVADLAHCDISFVETASEREKQAIVESKLETGRMVASSVAGFTERGAMLGLVAQDRRIVIEINREASERAGLRFSSKLLRLARLVRTRGSL
jgi:hypothetical protein